MPDDPVGAAAAVQGVQQAPGAETGTPAPPGPDVAQDGAEGGEPVLRSREAANYRARLRETEAERDTLLARLDQRDRADVERLAALRLHDPADLFASTGVDALRGDDGGIDAAKVAAAIDAVVAAKPYLGIAPRVPDFDAGVRASSAPPAPSFGAALKDAARSR